MYVDKVGVGIYIYEGFENVVGMSRACFGCKFWFVGMSTTPEVSYYCTDIDIPKSVCACRSQKSTAADDHPHTCPRTHAHT